MTDITNDVLRQELEQSFSQCLTAGTPTKMAAEIWVACVSTSRLDVWTKLLWQRQRRAGSAGGVKRLKERRYPDFEDRTHTLASLLTAVAPLLAMPGMLPTPNIRSTCKMRCAGCCRSWMPGSQNPCEQTDHRTRTAEQHGGRRPQACP